MGHMDPKGHFLRMAFFAGFLLAAGSGNAATIAGTVSDPEGTRIAGAQVIARERESNFSRTATTEEDGRYSFEALPPGVYAITVRKPGYADLVRENVAVGNAAAVVQVDLQINSARERTMVKGEEELNPNVFIVKLDTNEIKRELQRRGADLDLPREFRSQDNSFGAIYSYPLRRIEFARTQRALRNFHGSLYENHQNSSLNARSFFTVGKLLPSRRNQYGGTASTPLRGDRMSLSFAWSQLRDSGFVNGNIQAPLAEERTPRSPDPALNALIARLLEGFPPDLPNLPSVSLRQLNTNAERNIRNTAFSTRLDSRPREADQFVFEQRFLDYSEDPFELVVGQNPVTLLRPQSFHGTLLHSVSPRTVFRISFNFDRLAALLDLTERHKKLVSGLGIGQGPDVNFGGDLRSLGPGSNFPRRRVENRFHFAPEMTQVRGKSTVSLGANLTRFQVNDLINDNGRGTIGFTRNFGRSAVENFLLGQPTNLQVGFGNLYRGFRNWEDAFYLQDTYRASPHWTFSLGVRYEVITAPTEVNRLTSVGYHTDANNVAPQFGLAWNPGGGKTVVRGGYGMVLGTIFPLLYQRARFNPPAVLILEVFSPDLLHPLSKVDLSPTGAERSEVKQNSPDLVAPYSHLYSLQIERELPANLSLTMGYVGERTIKLPNRVISNRARPVPGIEAITATINQRRPDPRYLQVTTVGNGVIAYLDALHLAVSKRLSQGLTWNARYTFSKVISTGDTTFADIDTGNPGQLENDMIRDMKGVAEFDTPHAFTIGYSYEFPWGRNLRGTRRLLLGGWRVSGTTTYRSGTPLSVHAGSDAPGFGNVDGVNQPDRPNLLNPQILGKSIDHPDSSAAVLRREYFDTRLEPGGRGNIGFNTFRNDGTHNWNLAVEKEFPLGGQSSETRSLQLRAESFNAFHQPQFDPVNNTLATETFGKITNTANKGRVIQMLLRVRW